MVTTKWLAALSDGTTVLEGAPPFEEIDGELSPWQKLLVYLKERPGVHLTGLRVQVEKDRTLDDGTVVPEAVRTYNLPSHAVTSAGLHVKWQHVRPAIPIGYGYRTCSAFSIPAGQLARLHMEVYAGYDIGGTIYLLSLFVDKREGTESWTSLHVPDKVPVLV